MNCGNNVFLSPLLAFCNGSICVKTNQNWNGFFSIFFSIRLVSPVKHAFQDTLTQEQQAVWHSLKGVPCRMVLFENVLNSNSTVDTGDKRVAHRPEPFGSLLKLDLSVDVLFFRIVVFLFTVRAGANVLFSCGGSAAPSTESQAQTIIPVNLMQSLPK